MRVRTDDRRRAIIKAAKDIFRDVGFERASMAAISAKVGGSKATLYGYFKSKDELFAAAMIDALEDQGQDLIDLLDASRPDVEEVLHRFGLAYLTLLASPEALSVTRTAIAESPARERLGEHLYALGPQRGLDAITDYMRALSAREDMEIADPQIAAHQFKVLLEAGIMEPLLFGAPAAFTADYAVTAAVSTFIKAYRRN
ncbi:hypothetical protein SZ64_00895 [Erythrobacter sp. SG61-1L]|uniref:TetR/AcrR family transcriptional regulator n=1 Tax=Erythrobacter sp. SG61-1L TaxID=1603897 RepID=UPI0006C91EAD|nr:TetR/AcrR family transcriptional regulator [Erythrobacter sp. SG61-1L]KPL66785.1 hypothetical protein SZ64_00895 [Erythrobacter sp. SG61-1L]